MSANAGSPAHLDLVHFQYYLINGAFLSFLTPIPALASLFLAWIARRNRSQSRQEHGRPPQSHARKSNLNPLHRRLMIAAHVILWATFVSLLSSAVSVVIRGLHPPSVPMSAPIARLMSGSLICNSLATLTFQSTGEGVLVYQFMRMYPDPKPRRRVLPLAALLILVRFLSQTFNQVLYVALTVFPTSDAVTSWLEWQSAGAWIYSISLTSLILLLSASFVFKLWSRWREYRLSTRHQRHYRHGSDRHRSSSRSYYNKLLPSSMYRVRSVLAASWHHTVLSSISVVVMTVSFSSMPTNEAAKWVNAISISIFKIVFSLGIAQSLFHLCFDASTLFQPLHGHVLPQHIRAVPAAADEFGSDATLTSAMDPSFRYNSWDSRPAAAPLGTFGNESMFESAYDPRPRAAHGYSRRGESNAGYPTSTSWPIQSAHIESADLGVLGQSEYPRRSSSGRDRGGYGAPVSQGRRGQSPAGYRL